MHFKYADEIEAALGHISDGILQPFTIVYSTYAATVQIAKVYFDSVTIQSTIDYSSASE